MRAIAFVVLAFVHLCALLLATTAGGGSRRPDGRRGGPMPVGEPATEDRDQVAELSRQGAERRQREREALEQAAEPAGVPPSEDQRQAIEALRERSARVRGPAARALRRQPTAVGVVYDDEREQVEDLLADARERRLDEADERGIVDPALESQSAGFDPQLPHLPGHELYGNFECPNCGANVERSFPGYVDWDLASRDLVCSQCGGVVMRARTADQQQQQAEPSAEAERVASSYERQQAPDPLQPAGLVQTSAQPALSDQERAELEQLRAEKAARDQAPAQTEGQGEPTTEQQPPSG